MRAHVLSNFVRLVALSMVCVVEKERWSHFVNTQNAIA
jgi:hypothetical protein